MTVRRSRGALARIESELTTKRVLLGTAVVGAVGALVLATRQSTAPTSSRPPLAPRLSGPMLSQADCSSYLPSSLDPSDTSNTQAASQLAAFGACSGQNALVEGVMNLSIVRSIETAIEQGTAEAAQLTGLATLAFNVVGATTGVSVAAATSVMPIVGAVAAAVIIVADWINSLGPGPQIYVPNPNATGSDSITLTVPANISSTGTFEKINLKDYGGFVQNAMNWVNANPQQALSMTPAELSNQFSIFLSTDVLTQFANNSTLSQIANPLFNGENVYTQLASGNPPPPGAYEILRAVQLPAAAAICAAMPSKAGFLTNNGGAGGMSAAPLQQQFPALTTADMAAIFTTNQISTQYNEAIQNAQNFVNNQCPPVTDPSVLTSAPYSLALQDACKVLSQWAPVHPCPGYSAPNEQLVCTTKIATPIVSTPSSTSAATHVVKGTAVVAGGLGLGLLAYKLYTGYSFAKTTQELWGDIKKGASKVKTEIGKGASKIEKVAHRRHRKANPLVLPGRSSATGGRLVAYRIRMEEDVVEFSGDRATLYRNDVAVAVFKPSAFQKTKIRSGRGEVLVFKDQLQ